MLAAGAGCFKAGAREAHPITPQTRNYLIFIRARRARHPRKTHTDHFREKILRIHQHHKRIIAGVDLDDHP